MDDEVIEQPEVKQEDLAIELKAVKELLEEQKEANKTMAEELKQVKLSNAKLLNSFDTQREQKTIEQNMFELFNPYKN